MPEKTLPPFIWRRLVIALLSAGLRIAVCARGDRRIDTHREIRRCDRSAGEVIGDGDVGRAALDLHRVHMGTEQAGV